MSYLNKAWRVHIKRATQAISPFAVSCNQQSSRQWGPSALRHCILISMEAILACHLALSTKWLDWVARWCERWRKHTGPNASWLDETAVAETACEACLESMNSSFRVEHSQKRAMRYWLQLEDYEFQSMLNLQQLLQPWRNHKEDLAAKWRERERERGGGGGGGIKSGEL